VRIGNLLNTVAVKFNTITGKMTEMSQRKKTAHRPAVACEHGVNKLGKQDLLASSILLLPLSVMFDGNRPFIRRL